MIGETATTGARQAPIASRIPGTASIGSMLTKGFDGQMMTARSRVSRSAARTSAWTRAEAAPS